MPAGLPALRIRRMPSSIACCTCGWRKLPRCPRLAAEIGRTDEERVDAIDRRDRLERVKSGAGLDLHDKADLGVRRGRVAGNAVPARGAHASSLRLRGCRAADSASRARAHAPARRSRPAVRAWSARRCRACCLMRDGIADRRCARSDAPDRRERPAAAQACVCMSFGPCSPSISSQSKPAPAQISAQ